jgi:two-component system, response regulator
MSLLPTILLVDDDDDYLFVALRAIERTGLRAEVRVARSGSEALTLLGLGSGPGAFEAPPRIAVVMLDLRMPGTDGIEVLRRMQESGRTRSIPVVVVSSSDRPDDVRQSYELGANSYVVKRFVASPPGGYVAEAARYWVELNEMPRVPASGGSAAS